MPGIESLIDGSQKITDIFGYWPSFHDAEVIELHLWRGDVDLDRDRYVYPVFTVKIHVWELARLSESSDLLTRKKNTLTTLRFHDVHHDFRLEGIDHDNAIFELVIEQTKPTDGFYPTLSVHFARFTYAAGGQHGFGATFGCQRVEVVDAVSCSENGTTCHGGVHA